jgi:hypothetical protein
VLAAMEQSHIVASLVKCPGYMRPEGAGAANHQNPHLSKLTHRFLMRATVLIGLTCVYGPHAVSGTAQGKV